MKNDGKIIQLQKTLTMLNEFELNLSEENLQEFESLKSELNSLFDDNQRIRFNQLEFYTEIPNSQVSSNEDDLPF